jgi:hypothetical protein
MILTLSLTHAAVAVVSLLAAGFVAGALVMRNNYAWTKNVEERVKRAAKAAGED